MAHRLSDNQNYKHRTINSIRKKEIIINENDKTQDYIRHHLYEKLTSRQRKH